MKNKISDRERLLHILDAINIILDFSKNITFEQYSDDLKLRLALVKLLEIKSVRNVLVHEYFGIDYKIIWTAVNNKIPELKNTIEKILEDF